MQSIARFMARELAADGDIRVIEPPTGVNVHEVE
jgi:hypothetical protein